MVATNWPFTLLFASNAKLAPPVMVVAVRSVMSI